MEAWQEHGQDLVTAEIRASAAGYVVDEATGQVVEGSATKPTRLVEYWTFVRPVGANPWRLGAIQQPSACRPGRLRSERLPWRPWPC